MRAIVKCLSRFVGFLARLFGVTPDTVKEAREKNPAPGREN